MVVIYFYYQHLHRFVPPPNEGMDAVDEGIEIALYDVAVAVTAAG